MVASDEGKEEPEDTERGDAVVLFVTEGVYGLSVEGSVRSASVGETGGAGVALLRTGQRHRRRTRIC